MNICLGDEFEGSAVYFGRKDTADNCTSDLAASDDLEADGVRVAHVPGRAFVNVCQHYHGVEALASGARHAVVVRGLSSALRRAPAEIFYEQCSSPARRSSSLKLDESAPVAISNRRPRRTVSGELVNAHDGMFTPRMPDGRFWLFGTAYQACRDFSNCTYPCGWLNNTFAAYSSPTMGMADWRLESADILPSVAADTATT